MASPHLDLGRRVGFPDQLWRSHREGEHQRGAGHFLVQGKAVWSLGNLTLEEAWDLLVGNWFLEGCEQLNLDCACVS